MKLVTPLLDGMQQLERLNSADGFACYLVKREEDGQIFALKHISIPESQENVEALILTGAVPDRGAARDYYRNVAQEQAVEVRNWQKLAGSEHLAAFTGFQLDPKPDDEIGYDFYLLAPRRTSLYAFIRENTVSQLQALNLGIDLCTALCTLREAGYIHEDLKPENVFIDDNGRFLIGDLGIAALEDLHFASLPERFSNCYSAPELAQLTANLNPTIDIYSVGMILYHLFNGNRAPFEEEGKTLREADAQRLAGQELPGPLHADFELTQILLHACAPNPDDRYQTPQEFLQDLVTYMQKNDVLDTLVIAAPPEPEPEPEPEPAESDGADDAAEPETEPEAEADAEPDRIADAAAAVDAVVPAAETAEEQAGGEPASADEAADEQSGKPEPSDDGANGSDNAADDTSAGNEAPEQPSETDGETAESAAAPEASPATDDENAETPADAAAETAEAPQEPAVQEESDGETSDGTEDADAGEEDANLDEILASVNDMIEDDGGESEADEPSETVIPESATRGKTKRAKKKNGRGIFALLITLCVLAILGAAAYVFYQNWLCIVLSDVQAEAGGDYIAVTYQSSIPDAPLSAVCSDTYGNTVTGEFNGTTVVFRELSPGTQYFISFEAESPRILRGEQSVNATTTPAAQVESFTVTEGADATSVTLALVTSGTEPDEWIVTYEADGIEPVSLRFSGHTTNIANLTPGASYNFTLSVADGVVLAGQTQAAYDVPPEEPQIDVRADNLYVSSLEDGVMTVSWLSLGDAPVFWHVQCTSDDYDQIRQPSNCVATFEGIDPAKAYTFHLTAEGMAEPVTLELGANAPVVTAFTADTADGALALQWESDYEPEGGWVISYSAGDADRTRITADGNSAAIDPVSPGTQYSIILTAADGTSLIGPTVLSVTTPAE